MRRREFFAVVASMATVPFPLRAQQALTVKKVGFLHPGSRATTGSRVDAFLKGLRDGGFRAPEQIELVAEFADGDPARLSSLARRLIDQNVDVIAANSAGAAIAVRSATSTIPIVALDLETDPVASGMIASLSHPGGNLTGYFFDFPHFRMKLLELLKEVVPSLSKVGIIWDPNVSPSQLESVEAGAAALNLGLEKFEARNVAEMKVAFDGAKRANVDAVVVLSSPFFGANTKRLAQLCLEHSLPAVTLFSEFAPNGGLMSYGPNIFESYRRVGGIAAKLLQGGRPADTPVELPSKFELAINLKTAKALGVNVPPSLIALADEVIE